MANETTLAKLMTRIQGYRGLIYPVLAMSLVLVILIPLPTPLLDLLLIANITLSALVLLTVMYMNGPLEFTSFPSLLLSLTLFRLVLNTATTRLILTNADGTTAAAGHVIEEFARFVAAGSLAVGVIIRMARNTAASIMAVGRDVTWPISSSPMLDFAVERVMIMPAAIETRNAGI